MESSVAASQAATSGFRGGELASVPFEEADEEGSVGAAVEEFDAVGPDARCGMQSLRRGRRGSVTASKDDEARFRRRGP